MKRKLLALLLALSLLLSLAACGGNTVASSTAPQLPVNTLSGVLDNFTGTELSMTDTNGQSLDFDIQNAALQCRNGLLTGNAITLEYTGSIVGTDTSKADVVTVIDDDSNTAQQTAAATPVTVDGVIEDATMNAITVKLADGNEYTFNKSFAKVEAVNGLAVGNTVELTYVGTIAGTDTSGVQLTLIEDNAPNKTEPAQNYTVTAVNDVMYTTDNLNVRAGAGSDTTRIGGLQGGTAVTRTGVCSNGWSRIEYGNSIAYVKTKLLSAKPTVGASTLGASTTPPASSYTPPAPVSSSKPASSSSKPASSSSKPAPSSSTPTSSSSEPAPSSSEPVPSSSVPAPSSSVPTDSAPVDAGGGTPPVEETYLYLTGYVVDITMNALVLDVEGGDQVSLDVSNAARSYRNGIQVGNRAVIEYSGTLNGTDTSGVVVCSVTVDNANADNCYVYGTVTGGTSNSVSIITSDDIPMTFVYDEGALVSVTGGVVEGAEVRIEADKNVAGTTGNVFAAVSVVNSDGTTAPEPASSVAPESVPASSVAPASVAPTSVPASSVAADSVVVGNAVMTGNA